MGTTTEPAKVIGIYIVLGDTLADLEVLTIRQHADGRVTSSCQCEDETVLFARLIDGTKTNLDIMHSIARIVRERRGERIA